MACAAAAAAAVERNEGKTRTPWEEEGAPHRATPMEEGVLSRRGGTCSAEIAEKTRIKIAGFTGGDKPPRRN